MNDFNYKVKKHNRIFSKTKFKEVKEPRKSTMTDEEILEIRRMMNITPKDPNDKRGYPNEL